MKSAVTVFLVATFIVSVARADVILDQQHLFTSSIANSTNGDVSQMGQAFTVGLAGTLHHIDVYMFRLGGIFDPTGDPVFQLYNTLSGLPDGAPLFTTTVPEANVPLNNAAFVSFDLSSAGIAVNPGNVLAFAVTAASGVGPYFLPSDQGQAIEYVGGDAVAKFGANPWQNFTPPQDHSFRTFVETIPEPSGAVFCMALIGLMAATHRNKQST